MKPNAALRTWRLTPERRLGNALAEAITPRLDRYCQWSATKENWKAKVLRKPRIGPSVTTKYAAAAKGALPTCLRRNQRVKRQRATNAGTSNSQGEVTCQRG